MQERNDQDKNRLAAEKRKLSEGKSFTFDYEGKVLSIPGKEQEGMNVKGIRYAIINIGIQ